MICIPQPPSESDELRESRENLEGYLGFSIAGLSKPAVEKILWDFAAELTAELDAIKSPH